MPTLEPGDVKNAYPIVPVTPPSHYRVTFPIDINTKSQANGEGEWNTMPKSEEASFYNYDASIFKR